MGLFLLATNANLLVNVHPGHIRLAVVLDHAQECKLCRDHEKVGFIEGIKVGIHLAAEIE